MANYLTTLRGTLAAGTLTEIFQHSLAIQSNAEPSTIAASLVTSWDSAWKGPGGAISNLWPPAVTYTESTVAAIMGLTDGKVAAATHAAFPLGDSGTSVSGSIPSQSAVAISLVGGFRLNGAPMKGRFYLPFPSQETLDPVSGFLTPAAQGAIGTAMLGFLEALRAGGHTPSIWSRVEGNLHAVDLVRVGNKVDTIRRRRNAGAEVYVDHPLI